MVAIDGKALAKAIDAYCLLTIATTKDDFYASTGISSATLSQWRTGKYNPSKKKVEKIEKYVGIPIDIFILKYGERGNKKETPATDGGGLAKTIIDLPSEFQESLVRFVSLASSNPDKAARFLLFAAAELESDAQEH